MKVLLFLNGFEGCQTGIEDGFRFVLESRQISQLEWLYFEDFSSKNSSLECRNKMVEMSKKLQPNLIVFFHIGKFHIDSIFLKQITDLESAPKLVYDEGDMYGSWAKPITKSMKLILKQADVVSIRGLGKFYSQIRKYNSHIIFTPHHNDVARFSTDSNISYSRVRELVFIGNRVKSRVLSFIRRLPGAKGREHFVKEIGNNFPDKFKLYGNGWKGFEGDQGPIDFYKQQEVYQMNIITVAYEHYPEIPYYFSNRLPIALMNGSIYVCHYHEGYDKMFPSCDFIFFFKSIKESFDIVNYLLSLSDDELLIRSNNAKEFALRQYHPNVIWMNFFNNIVNKW